MVQVQTTLVASPLNHFWRLDSNFPADKGGIPAGAMSGSCEQQAEKATVMCAALCCV
jgi:hypothetical protein